jgi:hypothetical protein
MTDLDYDPPRIQPRDTYLIKVVYVFTGQRRAPLPYDLDSDD